MVIADAPWFRLPRLLPFGLAWPSAGAATVVIYHFVGAVYTMSITLALCKIVGVDANQSRIRGAVAADGFGSVVAVLFGGVPLVSTIRTSGRFRSPASAAGLSWLPRACSWWSWHSYRRLGWPLASCLYLCWAGP